MAKKEPVQQSIKLEDPKQELHVRDIGPAVGNQNKDMIDRRNMIADAADTIRAQEFTEPDGGTPPDDTQVDDVPHETHAEDEDKTEVVDAKPKAETKTYKIPVNGKMREFTEDQLIASASKVESADEYLRLSKESAKNWSTEALSQKDEPSTVEEDYRALAKALQVGTEEEAEQALRDLVEKTTAKLSKTPDVSQVVRSELTLRDEQAKFEDEFKDLKADPNLWKLVMDKDLELSKADAETPYSERWRKAASEVRDWAKGFKTIPTDKAARKAQVAPVPTAASRQSAVTEDEGPDDSTYIQQLAEKRGLGRAIRH